MAEARSRTGARIEVPDLLEVRADDDEDGTMRLYIDGELFPYGTVEGVTVGPMTRITQPAVTLRIVGMRVKVDWGWKQFDGKETYSRVTGGE
jgi:hypothetical protein